MRASKLRNSHSEEEAEEKQPLGNQVYTAFEMIS